MTTLLRNLSFAAIPCIALATTSCGNKTDTYSATNNGGSPYGNSPYYGPSGGYDSSTAAPPASDPYTGTTTGGYTAPPPAPAPAPAPYTGGGGGGTTHTVVAGDTLYSLSRRYGTTVSAIQSANGLTGTTIIKGSTLTIP